MDTVPDMFGEREGDKLCFGWFKFKLKRKLNEREVFMKKLGMIALAALAFLGITSSANAATAMLQQTTS